MSNEERIKFLERRVRQLWNLCQKFHVAVDTCEVGCCSTDIEIGLPDFDKADIEHFYDQYKRPRSANNLNVDDWGKCIYCDIYRKEHKQGFCDGQRQ